MNSTVRALTKEIARDVSAQLPGDADESDAKKKSTTKEPTEAELLTMIVISALTRLEDTDEGSENDDLLKVIAKAKKGLQRYEPKDVEHNPAVEEKGMDLGQYTHTKVFEGNDTKAAKFARLMGGAKEHKSPRLHAMYAPTHDKEERQLHDIEAQFQAAASHKGKKGLGM